MPATDEKQPIKYLPRAEMVAAIRAGGSVLVQLPDGRGVHATRIEDLPSEAEFAHTSGDKEKVATTREEILARRKALDDQLALLDEPSPVAAVTPPATPAPAPAPATPPPAPIAPAAVKVAPLPEPKVEPAKAEAKK